MKETNTGVTLAFHDKSCEHMDEVAQDSVNLVVTSPPYWNAIDYDQHVDDPAAWYRTRHDGPYQEYLDFMKVCFTQVYQKLAPGGFCAVIIGTVIYNGRHYPAPQNLTILMEEIGFIFHEDIIWHKVTGGVKRAGVTIQKPFPGYYFPNIMTESILVFRKPGPKIYERRRPEEKESSRYEIDGIFTREIANNVWHIAPVPPNYLPHPCPFPEEVPYRLVSLYSYAGDLVLDPFMGIGTTAKVALALGRHFVGYEVHAKYIEVARDRVAEPLHLRDQLIARFEKVAVQDERYLRNQEIRKARPEDSAQLSMPGLEIHERD